MKGPGIIFLIPLVDKMVKVSLRTVVMDVPPQDVITKDNVSIKVNAVVYFRVVQPDKAIVEVENFLFATSQLSQTTLRSILGQSELDELLAERDKINRELAEDHRPPDRAVGNQDLQRGGEADRPPRRDAAGHGATGGGGARTAGEGHPRGG